MPLLISLFLGDDLLALLHALLCPQSFFATTVVYNIQELGEKKKKKNGNNYIS